MNASQVFKKRILFFVLLLTMLANSGCNGNTGNGTSNEANLLKTIEAINYQSTIQVMQLTLTAVSSAPIQSTPSPEQHSSTPTTELSSTLVGTQPAIPSWEERMKKANILLFEDMVGIPKVRRYVKETLDRMGLPYEDIDSSKGKLKERLIFGTRDGQPWDLIILAIENRDAGSVTGEFFSYLLSNIDRGSAVIIEAWHLDRIHNGQIKPILDRCGVDVKNYVGSSGSTNDLLLWPLVDHPILTEPNNYTKLTAPLLYWNPSDYGDLMNLTGQGDAQLIIGLDRADKDKYGVVAVCLDGQLILQTFSSHNYYIDHVTVLWENYIYYLLKRHFGQ